MSGRSLAGFTRAGLAAAALGVLSLGLYAQQTGPLPPPKGSGEPGPAPAAPPKPQESQQQQTATAPAGSGIVKQAPAVPVEQIIQTFAQREEEFKKERDNYTYTQTFAIQTLDVDGHPDGEYRMVSDIVFTPAGKREEKVTFAPQSSLQRILLTQEDMDDLVHVQPFVLTTEQLPKYDISYVGREQVDELSTYVFDVKPKKLDKGQRYFDGRVWVDDKDLQIVKTYGQAVGLKKKNEDSAYPHFETFRENIEGHFWFPTFTRANDVLHFRNGDVPIHMFVRYENYKRFGSTIKLGQATEVKP
jgi:hypothetical protein